MRTTLDIEDDVLYAAKEIARREKKSLGQVISELARRAFALGTGYPPGGKRPAPRGSDRLAVYGIEPLPARGGLVTNELIDRLRDEEDI
ncbi:MAG: CopG family transcriptional regulator [Ramlibacter sp.]